MSQISLLHTGEAHVATFDRLFQKLAPEVTLRHAVHQEWLDEAREKGLHPKLTEAVAGHLLAESDISDMVICTCSTLGPIADAVQLAAPNIMRIDRPMMDKAAQCLVAAATAAGVPLDKRSPTPVLVALCLESTRASTLALLKQAFVDAGVERSYDVVMIPKAWPLFESGAIAQFNKTVAKAVTRQFVALNVSNREPCCVVLGQASMAGAAHFLEDLGVPILGSPFLAVKAALAKISQPS